MKRIHSSLWYGLHDDWDRVDILSPYKRSMANKIYLTGEKKKITRKKLKWIIRSRWRDSLFLFPSESERHYTLVHIYEVKE